VTGDAGRARSKPQPDARDRYVEFVTVTTRLMDNDLYDHVNNATYYSFIDTAVTTCLLRALRRDLAHDPISYLVVENGCVYFRPLAFPDTVHCGLRVTPHGAVDTPAFMPVGTYGAVKAMAPRSCARSARRSCWATPSTCGCARGST
jgi:hypothetical protein